jgi:hypothetical protein
MDKQKIVDRLRTYSWQELDWVERTARSLKKNADGIRVYSNIDADPTSMREASDALAGFFEESAAKHGIY